MTDIEGIRNYHHIVDKMGVFDDINSMKCVIRKVRLLHPRNYAQTKNITVGPGKGLFLLASLSALPG